MVLVSSLPVTEREHERASSKAQYDFRLDEQDWEKVCWGRLPKGLARSPAHQLSRRAKWAAVLRGATSPQGGSWDHDFRPEDMTPHRLQALARLIDLEFFQGTFHREVARRAGRHLSYCSGDFDEQTVPRGDAVMAAATVPSPPPPPLSAGGCCCATAAATAATAGFRNSPASDTTTGAAALAPRATGALRFRYRQSHPHTHFPRRGGAATGGFPWERKRQPQRAEWSQPQFASAPLTASASARLETFQPCSSSGSSSSAGWVGAEAGRGGDGGGGASSDRGVWGWLRGLRRRRLCQGQAHNGGGGGGGAAAGGDAGGGTAADASAPSAMYTHSRTRITLWRQVWAAHSPSVGNPVRLDGVVCSSRLCWLAHTLGHEMLHALIFNMCGTYARDAPRNLSLEGHGYNFLMLNWYVLGHRGYTYNPRGWTPPPALPCRL